MKKKNKIPTILGVVILLVGVFAGVFFLNMRQVFRIGADASASPKDIRVGNISDTSATISWTTDKETSGFVNWGESQGGVNKVETEGDQKSFSHLITITGLTAGKTYYYKISSDGSSFENGGIPWQFTLGPTLGVNRNSTLISGSVVTSSGLPAKRALVHATVSGYLLSTLTSDTGNFVFQLSAVRTTDLSSYQNVDPASTLIEISVQAGGNGVASAQVFPRSASPIPAMVLGQVYDFRSLPPSSDSQNPDANVTLPGDIANESKFKVENPSGTPNPTTSVILENIDEGETVTSDQPQFFGKGPGGEEITITVHSETPISETVSIPTNGSWSWSPSEALAAGAHSITITWKDATGITRSLTRNFVVQAGEAPAFTASESGSTASPSPTTSASPTATPVPTPIATSQPVPETGSLTPTILLSIMGIAVLLFSFAIWKIAEINA